MTSKRIPSFDALRILASIGVITIHAAATAFTSEGMIPLHEWLVVDILACAVRWSVPIFVMLSGALILSKPIDHPFTWIKQKFASLAVPTLLWTLIYAVIYSITRGTEFSVLQLGHDILFNQPYEHLYFLYILLQLYVLAPFLHHALERASKRSIQLTLLLCIIASFYWFDSRFVFTIAIPYLSYFLAGFYFWKFSNDKQRKLAPYLFFGSTLLMAFGTWHWTMVDRITDNVVLMNFHKPLVFIQTVSVFLMAKPVSIPARWHSFMHTLAKASFGVYVAHPLVMLGLTYAVPQLFPAMHVGEMVVILVITSFISYVGILFSQQSNAKIQRISTN